jgi:O-antigen/teichoic acid export membrane protein
MANQPGAPEGAEDMVQEVAAVESPPPSQDFATAGRNALKLAFSLTATWTIAFFIRFPIPRALGPARYGLLTFSENFSAAFFTLVELGVTTYIFREIPVRPKHASDFWGGLILVRIVVGVLLYVAMAVSLAVSHQPFEVQAAAFIYGSAYFVTAFNNSAGAFLHATSKVDRLALTNVLSKFVWGLGLAGAIVFSRALPMFALPLLVSELLKLAVLYPGVRRAVQLEHRVDLGATKAVLLAALPFFISSGAVNIGNRLNVAVLEFVTPDQREVGWFGAAQNLASLTMLLSPLLNWVCMPILARARARSQDEVYEILRRIIEGLLVVVIPMTLVVSLGADLWVRLAFRAPFDPAASALRFLAMGFILVYLAMMLSMLLVMLGRGWSISMISLGAVAARAILLSLLVNPCARRFGPGGGALGAALSENLTGLGVVAANFMAIGTRAIDGRVLATGGKSLAVAIVVMILDRGVLAHLGWSRLAIDMTVYVALVFAVGGVKVRDVTRVVRVLRARRAGEDPGLEPSSPPPG